MAPWHFYFSVGDVHRAAEYICNIISHPDKTSEGKLKECGVLEQQ